MDVNGLLIVNGWIMNCQWMDGVGFVNLDIGGLVSVRPEPFCFDLHLVRNEHLSATVPDVLPYLCWLG